MPIESPTVQERHAITVQQRLEYLPPTTTPVQNPPFWQYTMHVVSTRDDYNALLAQFPNLATDDVLIVRAEDADVFGRYFREVNAIRAQNLLPAMKPSQHLNSGVTQYSQLDYDDAAF